MKPGDRVEIWLNPTVVKGPGLKIGSGVVDDVSSRPGWVGVRRVSRRRTWVDWFRPGQLRETTDE